MTFFTQCAFLEADVTSGTLAMLTHACSYRRSGTAAVRMNRLLPVYATDAPVSRTRESRPLREASQTLARNDRLDFVFVSDLPFH